jgi:CTP:molybdopterin cytidylyltransferase MocA
MGQLMVRAVILAAGASSRMGRPKAGLALRGPDDTFLSRLIRTYLMAELSEIVVVTGADQAAVRSAWGGNDSRVQFVDNPDWRAGQLSSLLAALDAAAGSPIDALMIALVDVPLVAPATITRLLSEWRRTRAPIVRPARGDEHGHPVIFDAAIFDELRRADPRVGAKAVVRAYAARILNVPIDDPGAYRDIDTPNDYDQLEKSF